MKIKSLEYKKINIEMKKPFKIALGSTDFYEGYFVKVTTDNGLSGYGEAIPTPFITGDTMGSVEAELSIFSQALKGMELSTEALNEKMKALARSSKASRAAVDMAVYDIIGKKADLPLYILLGGYRTSMKTSYTVDLVDAPHAKVQAKELLDDGVEFFKIKLGSFHYLKGISYAAAFHQLYVDIVCSFLVNDVAQIREGEYCFIRHNRN